MLSIIAFAAALQSSLPKVQGDFDRDGKKDVAEIVRAAGVYRVVIHPGAQPNTSIVVATLGPRKLDFFFDIARSGEWQTWCGKGGGSDNEPCPRTAVTLKGGELTFGVREAFESVVIWTGKRFEVVLLSD